MGTNKLISSVWLFLLIVISIPVGGYFALGTQKFGPDDFWLKFIAGSIAMIIALGVISWLVFRYYRRTKDEKAAYRGLFVYSFLLVWFVIIALVMYPKAQKEQAQAMYLENFESEMVHEFEEIVKKVEPLNSDLKFEIHFCAKSICDQVKRDENLLEKLMKDKLPYSKELIEKYPKLKEHQNSVIKHTEIEILSELLTIE